jgi:pimeloyl-ACP methyl ester carboxylesterase
VLVHGFAGSINEWVDSGVLANLARDYRVIALDLRGHGQSEKPHEVADYGERMALDVIRLMDHLGIPKAHVVGYSQGARIVGFLLATHGNRFLSAVLGGSPPRVGWPEEEARRSEQDAQDMEKRAKEGCSDGQDYIALAAVARSRQRQVVTTDQLGEVTVPTIEIVGSEDPRLPGMQELKKQMPALQKVVVVDGATHGGECGTMRRPEFVDAVRELIASRGPSAKGASR